MLSPLCLPLPPSSSAYRDALFKPPCIVVTLNHVQTYTAIFETHLFLYILPLKTDKVSAFHTKILCAF